MNGRRIGFTLIEVLMVVGIIGVLAGVVFVSINPPRRFAQARNTQRESDVLSILNAILSYQLDNDGQLPTGVDSVFKMIGSDISGCNVTCAGQQTAASCLNLSLTLAPGYISQVPFDPRSGSSGKTYYAVRRVTGGQVRVTACSAELGELIEATK